jgi:hypothetical protein
MLCCVWVPRGESTPDGDSVQAVRILTEGTCVSFLSAHPTAPSPFVFQKRQRGGGGSRSTKATIPKKEDISAQILPIANGADETTGKRQKHDADARVVPSTIDACDGEVDEAEEADGVEAEEKSVGAQTAPPGEHHTGSLLLRKKKKKKKKQKVSV